MALPCNSNTTVSFFLHLPSSPIDLACASCSQRPRYIFHCLPLITRPETCKSFTTFTTIFVSSKAAIPKVEPCQRPADVTQWSLHWDLVNREVTVSLTYLSAEVFTGSMPPLAEKSCRWVLYGHDMDVSILRARSDPNLEVDLPTRLYRVRIDAIGWWIVKRCWSRTQRCGLTSKGVGLVASLRGTQQW